MSKNNITGDEIRTKGMLSKEGEENWDRIFGKKIKEQKLSLDDMKELFDDKFREERNE